jgi:ABC-type multidrug transport system fused ATPase/permease subunit
LIVLDDVFSAVDAHVGKQLWNQAVRGFLRAEGKTVLLVTNQLQYVPGADHVVMLRNGFISEQGTFKSLMSAKGVFSEMIKEYGVFDDHEETPRRQLQRAAASSKYLGIVDRSNPDPDATDALKGVLTFAENKEKGTIGIGAYWGYIQAGGIFLFLCNMALYTVRTAARVNNALFLSEWASLGPAAYQVQPQLTWQAIYIAQVVIEILSVLANTIILAYWAGSASRELHNRMFVRILRAPISFYDATPIGRLLARFSKDMNLCDTLLPQQWDQMFNMFVLAFIGPREYI